jgi:hypothetical protein
MVTVLGLLETHRFGMLVEGGFGRVQQDTRRKKGTLGLREKTAEGARNEWWTRRVKDHF